jgi:hypothetical protein
MNDEPENQPPDRATDLRRLGDPEATAAAKILATGVPVAEARNLAQSLRGFGMGPAPSPVGALAPLTPSAPAPEPPTYSAKEMLAKLMETPLYEPIPLYGKQAYQQIFELRLLKMQYDRYCPVCKKETPWSTVTPQSARADWTGPFALESKCGRCQESATMLIRSAPTVEAEGKGDEIVAVTKYGQWPALVSFHQNDLEKYRKVTSREQRSDFVRAVQAASQGFAAGACTYLRRVLESINREALAEKRKTGVDETWEAEYKAAKTNRQMEMLSGFLPEFLLKNKRLYNLLSEGLHNMTDDECRELFPNLRQAIQLIFKGRQELLTAREHEAEISKFISQNDPGRS